MRINNAIKSINIEDMPYEVAFQDIINLAEAAQSRYYVLTGSAGNGKTNMLCSITELLIHLKQGVVFLNAREIDGNVADYMLRVLGGSAIDSPAALD